MHTHLIQTKQEEKKLESANSIKCLGEMKHQEVSQSMVGIERLKVFWMVCFKVSGP